MSELILENDYEQPWYLEEYCAVKGATMFTASYQHYDPQYCDGRFLLVQHVSDFIAKASFATVGLSLLVTLAVRSRRNVTVLSPLHLLILAQVVFLGHVYLQLGGIASLMIPMPRRGGYDDFPSLMAFAASMTLVAGTLNLMLYERELERRTESVKEREEHREMEPDWDQEVVHTRMVLMCIGVGTAAMIYWLFGLLIWPVVHLVTGIQILRAALSVFKVERDVEHNHSPTRPHANETMPWVAKFTASVIILHAILTVVFLFANYPGVWDGWAPLEFTHMYDVWELLFDGLGAAVILILTNEEYKRIA